MPQKSVEIWSVSQLTRRVKSLLETEVSYIWVSGEISNYRVSPAGHAYFTLKDADSQIDAVMFRGKLMNLRFGPESGLEVIVYGLITVYEKRGSYQIICDEMQPKGMGALQLAFEKLRKRLQGEGLFDEARKKPLPLLPKRIGVVTSPTGAAIRDILNVIRRRFANVHVILWPARVQGDEAAPEIAEGVTVLDEWGVDVMIVGRGGGSLEDLWPFNEEVVVRAISAAQTPIISAVGHEIDFTLSDFAADVRAPTPSAAAELVVQEREGLVRRVTQFRQRLINAVRGQVERVRHRVEIAQSSYVFQRPGDIVAQRRQRVDDLRLRLEASSLEQAKELRARLERCMRALTLLSPDNQVRRASERLESLRQRLSQAGVTNVERLRGELRTLAAQLNALSPVAILSRGYSLAWKLPERTLVRDSSELAPGDSISLLFGKGGATASIQSIEESADGRAEI
jgi:exodeoxyribonuclease VII large subunit